VNKIFEVGVSESLREHMRRFNLDIIEKVTYVLSIVILPLFNPLSWLLLSSLFMLQAGLCISTELDYVYELVS